MEKIYKNLGVNQSGLALLIDAEQPALSYNESGERHLSSSASTHLYTIYTIVNALPVAEVAVPKQGETSKSLSEAAWYWFQYEHWQKKLDEMKDAYSACTNMLAFLDIFSAEPLTERQNIGVGLVRAQTKQKIERNNWAAQQKLRLKIATLQAMAEVYESVGLE